MKYSYKFGPDPNLSFNDEINQYYYLFEKGIGSKPYRCVITFIGGMGTSKAALAGDRLIQQFRPTTIINIGIAASMDRDVSVGDIVETDFTVAEGEWRESSIPPALHRDPPPIVHRSQLSASSPVAPDSLRLRPRLAGTCAMTPRHSSASSHSGSASRQRGRRRAR